MVKVEIRPGIWIRLTEEEARKRGVDVEAKPVHKAAKPQATKKAKPKADKPAEPVVAEIVDAVEVEAEVSE